MESSLWSSFGTTATTPSRASTPGPDAYADGVQCRRALVRLSSSTPEPGATWWPAWPPRPLGHACPVSGVPHRKHRGGRNRYPATPLSLYRGERALIALAVAAAARMDSPARVGTTLTHVWMMV